MGLELDLEHRLDAVLALYGAAPPGVEPRRDSAAALAGRRLRNARAEQHEQGVGVAVDDGLAAFLDRVAGAADDLVPAPRDAAREARVVEAAAGRAEDAVEGVHQDLRRLRHRRVAALLRPIPLLPDGPHESGQDRALARERRALEPLDALLAGGVQRVGVDAEGADDARIQALEVEDEDVVVEPGLRVEDVSPGTPLPGPRIDHVRCDPARPVQPRQVEVVERRHRAALPVHPEPGELGPAHRELDESGLLDDLGHEPAVLDVVGREPGPVVLVEADDLADPVAGMLDALAPPEHLLRDVLQLEGLERPERGAQGVDAVEHHASRDARDVRARGRPRLENRGPLAAARDVESDAEPPAAPGDEVEVEPDHVPPEDEVGVVLGEPREQAREQSGFVRQRLHRRLVAGHSRVAHHQHPLVVRRVQRDRVERAVEPCRLDVERDPPQRGAEVVAPQRGVAHLEVAGALHRLASRREARGHEALHEEAVGGLQVGLEGRDAPAAKQVAGLHQIALAPEVEGVGGRTGEGREVERAPPARYVRKGVAPGRRRPLHEAHRLLPVEHDAQRPPLRCGPERELQSVRGVPPVAGEEERAERVHRPARGGSTTGGSARAPRPAPTHAPRIPQCARWTGPRSARALRELVAAGAGACAPRPATTRAPRMPQCVRWTGPRSARALRELVAADAGACAPGAAVRPRLSPAPDRLPAAIRPRDPARAPSPVCSR